MPKGIPLFFQRIHVYTKVKDCPTAYRLATQALFIDFCVNISLYNTLQALTQRATSGTDFWVMCGWNPERDKKLFLWWLSPSLTEPCRGVMSAPPTGQAVNLLSLLVGLFIITPRQEPVKANHRKTFLSSKSIVETLKFFYNRYTHCTNCTSLTFGAIRYFTFFRFFLFLHALTCAVA